MPYAETVFRSFKKNGIIRAHAALTNKGLIRLIHIVIHRNYNEDRVSIILNIKKPKHRAREEWPRSSFFGVYDGHGGSFAADFLRDNLHLYVASEPCFPASPADALSLGFAKAEQKILDIQAAKGGSQDKSGSCAVVALIVGNMCYIANVGDSRAILGV
eukprot:TRINITY_DN3793_c0_g5_i4.p2 TRINITY_DN3793_c0_g5~~TRINITY_DN3793_c0_g5_i4.p2  ORF type:complete len:159 (-),score=33.08 TRINITY_DN3793_c0_g5_i4:812-1288(-)